MRVVEQYFTRNRDKILEIFNNNSQDDSIPATKIFPFLQQAFSTSSISISKDGEQFFKDDNNENYIVKVIQRHFHKSPVGKDNKFSLYRVDYSYDAVRGLLKFWFDTDKTLIVKDPLYKPYEENTQTKQIQSRKQNQETRRELPSEMRESKIINNEFLSEKQKKPMLIFAYQSQIKRLEQLLLTTTQNEEQTSQIESNIELLQQKLKELQTVERKVLSSQNKSLSKQSSSLSAYKALTQSSKEKKPVNMKLLFQFYAKQNHLTGVKASFERIEHESQTINYQKLVHFLKEHNLFPQKPKDQKKMHNLYVRTCSNTRDLYFQDFMDFLDKVPQIVITLPQGSTESKKEVMMAQIQSKNLKNKALHNPFHSPEKQDFRIDKEGLKYQFKLKPIKGKLESQVSYQLQDRKKQKETEKQQLQKEKKQKQLHKLKRLMSIDPNHPLVLKNAHLLRQRNHSMMNQPVASLDNMQKFRDASFDMKSMFGISDFDQDPLKAMQSNRYSIQKRAQLMQRQQQLKMSNLMSGIIQRSEAKLVKLGLSPRRKQSKIIN